MKGNKPFLFEVLRRTLVIQIKMNKSKALNKTIEKLMNRQKEVIRLKYLEGMDYEEIEQTTKLKYETIHYLSSETNKFLRRQLSSLVFSLPVVVNFLS